MSTFLEFMGMIFLIILGVVFALNMLGILKLEKSSREDESESADR